MFFFVCLFVSFCYGPLIGRCFLFVFFLALLLKTSRGTRCGQDRRLSSPTIRNDSSKKKTKDNRPFNDKRGRCTVFGRLDPLHRKKKSGPLIGFRRPISGPIRRPKLKKKNKKAKLIGRVRLSNGLSAEIRENGISLGDPPMIYGIT